MIRRKKSFTTGAQDNLNKISQGQARLGPSRYPKVSQVSQGPHFDQLFSEIYFGELYLFIL